MMTTMSRCAILFLAFALRTALGSKIPGITNLWKNAPNTGMEWETLENGIEFQRSGDMDPRNPRVRAATNEARHRMLANSADTGNSYTQQFQDGAGTFYSEYSQAWRLLGIYIDCALLDGESHNLYYNVQENDEEKDNDRDWDVANKQQCQRYLLWAAYVDLEYEGGGIGEYQYWDRNNQRWDASSCEYGNSNRCAKMDCHLENTHFSLLGYFKEPDYHRWMEQLFKHEGVCIWDYDEYSLMQQDRVDWPYFCTPTYQKDEDGNYLYYDLKPLAEGRMTLALYVDDRCFREYSGDLTDIETVLAAVYGDYNGNEDSSGNPMDLQESMEAWSDAFDVFKICQPCVAYNLKNVGEDLGKYSYGNGNGNKDDANNFDCNDDADYLNVNQCMKFKTKTDMLTATFNDIQLAVEQGTIVSVSVNGLTNEKTLSEAKKETAENVGIRIGFFLVSLAVCAGGIYMYMTAKAKTSSLNEPLVSQNGVVA